MNTETAKKIGEKGGKVRASRLTPSQRSDESRHANAIRWERQRERERLTAEVVAAAKSLLVTLDERGEGGGDAESLEIALNALEVANAR